MRSTCRRISSMAAILIMMSCAARPLRSQAADPQSLAEIAKSFSGRMSVAALHLESGRTLSLNEDQKVQTASVIKLAIMVEAFHQAHEGKLSLDAKLTATEADRVPGSGILKDLSAVMELKLLDAIRLMIVLSDNEAANLVIDRVGVENVNKRMQGLGLKNTTLFRKVFATPKEPQSEEAKKFGLGVTTPQDMVLLLQHLAKGALISGAASNQMIEIMKQQRDRDGIPRCLGRLDLGGKVEVANKTGALNKVRNDVGIVFTPRGRVLVAIFCEDSGDEQWTADNEATLAVARASEFIVRRLLAP